MRSSERISCKLNVSHQIEPATISVSNANRLNLVSYGHLNFLIFNLLYFYNLGIIQRYLTIFSFGQFSIHHLLI